jgi:predicted SnoaL-like aldol condensation-catalyzing enzyme
MKDFIRDHFEQFVNQKNLNIADANFAVEFIDHGPDVPPGTAPGPAGAKQYVGGAYQRFPDIHVQIEDLTAEDDRVVVRNHWTGTDATTNQRIEFREIQLADCKPKNCGALGIPGKTRIPLTLNFTNQSGRKFTRDFSLGEFIKFRAAPAHQHFPA